VRWKLHSFDFAFGSVCVQASKGKCVQCAVALKLKNKKCALAKNKTSLRWLVGLAVSPSVMLSKSVRFMSVRLMLVLSLSYTEIG
jgi:hypothetical protein